MAWLRTWTFIVPLLFASVSMQSQRAIDAPTWDMDMELALLRKLKPADAARLEQPSPGAR